MVDFWLEIKKRQHSIEIMASRASDRAEIEAGVVDKADQHNFDIAVLCVCYVFKRVIHTN